VYREIAGWMALWIVFIAIVFSLAMLGEKWRARIWAKVFIEELRKERAIR
jgi:hypothetical protein